MAASTLIRFDTTAPTVTLGLAVQVGFNVFVEYTTSEPATIEATVEIDGLPYDVVADPDEFIVSDVPSGADEVVLTITAADDVLNEAIYELTALLVEREFDYPLGMTINPAPVRGMNIVHVPHYMAIDDPGRNMDIDTAPFRDMDIDPITERGMTVAPIVQRWMGIEPTVRGMTVEDIVRYMNLSDED